MVLHSQTDISPLINSHFSGGKHLLKQRAVLYFVLSSLYPIVAMAASRV